MMDSPGRRSRLPACSSNSEQLTGAPRQAWQSHAIMPSAVTTPGQHTTQSLKWLPAFGLFEHSIDYTPANHFLPQ